MFQGYYQVHLYAGTFFQPAVSYIPTPGVSSSLGSAWAVTFRFTVLFWVSTIQISDSLAGKYFAFDRSERGTSERRSNAKYSYPPSANWLQVKVQTE